MPAEPTLDLNDPQRGGQLQLTDHTLADYLQADVPPTNRTDALARELAGLDELERPINSGPSTRRKAFDALWPRLLAVTLLLVAWQVVVWTKWRPDYLLPGPGPVFARLRELAGEATFWTAIGVTMRRALTGFALALVIGTLLGIAASRFRALRAGVGSFITGLQTMPSIAWFPLAVLLFKLSESAIMFVIVLGAAPSVANGLLSGIDHVPPLLRRAGRVLGASGINQYRHIILPAALPTYIAGLKQGWAFAWRSLMAGELLVIIANRPSLGAKLQFARELSDAPGLLAFMIVILTLGIAIDTVFTRADLSIRRRRGLYVQ
jgi:NitT/TauT family transport system permease protein